MGTWSLDGTGCAGVPVFGGASFLSGDGGTGEGVRMVTFDNMISEGS